MLPPFAPFSRPAAPAPVEAAPSAADTEALPDWLTWVEPAQEAAPEAGAEVEAAPVGESWAQDDAPGVEDYLAAEEGSAAEEALALSVETAPGEAPPEEETAVAAAQPEESWAVEAPPGAAEVPGGGPQLDEALTGALSGVADRLEEIARALRERPAEVLGGTGAGEDPLELLVTGFVLGYAQGRGRAG